MAPAGSVFDLKPIGEVGRGLVLGQAVDEVVHDDVGEVDVLARGVVEVVAADRVAVAVAAEDEDVEVGPGKADAGGERQGAAVDEVEAVAVDEVGEARRAADAGDGDDLLVRDLKLLENVVRTRRARRSRRSRGTRSGGRR